MKICVPNVTSLICVRWHATTNQIFCSTASGCTRVFYDPRYSKKGALLSAARAPKREKDPTDYAIVGEIITPHALPLFKKDNSMKKRNLERKEAALAHVPARPVTVDAPKKDVNTSFFFTKYVMEGKTKSDLRSEDPREALLKYNDITTKDPIYFGGAYGKTQPKSVLAEQTYEEEEEHFRKKQKESI